MRVGCPKMTKEVRNHQKPDLKILGWPDAAADFARLLRRSIEEQAHFLWAISLAPWTEVGIIVFRTSPAILHSHFS